MNYIYYSLVLFAFFASTGCRMFTKDDVSSVSSNAESQYPGVVRANLKNPIKAIWVSLTDSDVLHSKEGVTEAVNRICKLSEFNTVLPIVYTRGKIYFKSKILSQRYPGLIDKKISDNNSRDILAEFIQEASKCERKLKVFPWVEYGLRVPDKITKAENLRFMEFTNSIKKNHPGWLLPGSYARTPSFQHAFLDPRNPEVQDFIILLNKEILDNYPSIAGLNIDDNFSIHAPTIRNEYYKSKGSSLEEIADVVVPEVEYQHFDQLKDSNQPEDQEEINRLQQKIQASEDAKKLQVEANAITDEIRNSTTYLFARLYDLHLPGFASENRVKKHLLFTPHEGITFAFNEWLIDIASMVRGKNRDYITIFPHGYRADRALDLPRYLHKLYGELSSFVTGEDRRPPIFRGVAILSGTKANYTRTPNLLQTIAQLERYGLGYAVFFYETILGKYAYQDRISKVREKMR